MRKVFRAEPSQRQVVREIADLLDDYSVDTNDMHVEFWENGNACYQSEKDTIKLPDPQWTATVSGPDYDWAYYWQTVAHEVAHRIIYKWYGGINHADTFYSVLIALCAWWDLPPYVMDSELGYHSRNYRAGKRMLASMVMDRMYRISLSDPAGDCDHRPIFDTQSCSGKPCMNHKPESDDQGPDTEKSPPKQRTVIRAIQ